jgi:hypothetical protein
VQIYLPPYSLIPPSQPRLTQARIVQIFDTIQNRRRPLLFFRCLCWYIQDSGRLPVTLWKAIESTPVRDNPIYQHGQIIKRRHHRHGCKINHLIRDDETNRDLFQRPRPRITVMGRGQLGPSIYLMYLVSHCHRSVVPFDYPIYLWT